MNIKSAEERLGLVEKTYQMVDLSILAHRNQSDGDEGESLEGIVGLALQLNLFLFDPIRRFVLPLLLFPALSPSCR